MHTMFDSKLETYLKQLETTSAVKINNRSINLPLRYRCSAINLAFPIATVEAKKIIKNKDLKILEIFPRTTLLCVTIFDFITSDIGPFTEITTSIPVSYKSNINIPPFTILSRLISNKISFYVVNIAQSSQDAIDHGNQITGYPHYNRLIDLRFDKNARQVIVKGICDNEMIFNLIIKRPVTSHIKFEEYDTFKVDDAGVKRILLKTYGFYERARLEKIELGDHELAEAMKMLKLKKFSIDTRYYDQMIKVIDTKQ